MCCKAGFDPGGVRQSHDCKAGGSDLSRRDAAPKLGSQEDTDLFDRRLYACDGRTNAPSHIVSWRASHRPGFQRHTPTQPLEQTPREGKGGCALDPCRAGLSCASAVNRQGRGAGSAGHRQGCPLTSAETVPQSSCLPTQRGRDEQQHERTKVPPRREAPPQVKLQVGRTESASRYPARRDFPEGSWTPDGPASPAPLRRQKTRRRGTPSRECCRCKLNTKTNFMLNV